MNLCSSFLRIFSVGSILSKKKIVKLRNIIVIIFPFQFFFREFQSMVSTSNDILYHQIKTPIDFWCWWELNPRFRVNQNSLISISIAVPMMIKSRKNSLKCYNKNFNRAEFTLVSKLLRKNNQLYIEWFRPKLGRVRQLWKARFIFSWLFSVANQASIVTPM